MLKSLIFTLAATLSLAALASPQLFDNGGKYIYFITPSCETAFKDQADALNEARDYIVDNLKEIIGDNDVAEKPVEFIAKHKDEIENINLGVIPYLQYDTPFFQFRNLCPSATVLTFGTGGTKSLFKLSVGGSFTLGAVVQWVKIERINKTNPDDIKVYTRLKGSIVLIGLANIGAGVGGGPSLRIGGGLVFGPMSDPSEFYGIYAGGSGTMVKGVHGIQAKATMVVNGKGKQFGYLAGAYVRGASATKAHLNVGWIQPLANFMGAVNKVTGQFLVRGSKEYKELRELGEI